jgi:hypothetical protein
LTRVRPRRHDRHDHPAAAPAFLDVLIAESNKVPARVWQATFQGLLDAEIPTESGAIG